MPDLKNCAECGAALPTYWPKGLCAQCALDGALDLTNVRSQVIQGDETIQEQAPTKPANPISLGSSVESSPLGSFGEYDLLEEIARGGMGVVYKARQRNLGRLVAVKMILAGTLAGKEFVQRFRTESAAAAILQHPGIVAVHDVGVLEGRHYFSMDYVEGQNLAELVGQLALPANKAARYVEHIALAIHYAHEHGILHRDLKPSNVLIDANDQPRITDFGLAKRLDGESSLTLSGQVLGSPNFMPPEQAGVKHGKVGRPSDVYALGGILYYLLTARAPFQADSLERLITQVLNVEPVSPRLLNASIPRDLETITLKCLEKEPSRRYQTARELADELGRVQRHEPIHSRPVNAPEKLWRWCRRKPAFAGVLGLAVAALVVGFAATAWQWRRAERNAVAEHQERERAEAQAYASDMNLAQQALTANNLGRALELLDRHRASQKSETRNPKPAVRDLRGWEWRYLWQQAQSDELFTLCGKPVPIFSLAISPGARLLTIGESNYGHLTIWDLQSRQEILRLPEGNRPDIFYIRAAFSPTEPLLAYGSSSGFFPSNLVSRVRLLNLDTRQQVAEFPLEFLASGISFSPDGNSLITSTPVGTKVWDVHSGQVRKAYPYGSHQGLGTPFSITPDFRLVAQGFNPDGVRVFELGSGMELWKTNTTQGPIGAVAISADGRMLATAGASEESTLRLWNAQDGRMLASFDKFPGGALQLLFSPDQRMLISANMDQTIRIWDVSNPALVPPPRILIGHTLEVWRLALMPDGKTLISGGKDGSVRFWDLTRPPSHRGSITLPGGPFVGWSFSGNDSALLTCDSKGRITRWSGEAWQTTNILRETGGSATTACFLPDRQEVAIASNEQGLRVFRWTDSALPRVLPAFVQNEGVWVLRRHGNRLAVGRFDQQLVRDFEIDTWELKESWGAPGTFAAMDFSRDGRYCVMGGFRGQVLVRNMVNGQESSFVEAMPNIGILGDHRCGPVAFSTFSDRVAICSQQGFARLWETGSWRDAGVIGGFLHAVAGLAFSPEGTRLAAGSSGEEAIRLYEMERYQALVTLGAEGVGFVPAFDASGNILAGMNTAGKLHIWRAPSWREIEEKERTADRPGMR